MTSKSLTISKQYGFTLIELMIVVGIIGILVSIPSTNYERYTSRVRQSEAKLGLSAIYSLERGFYSEYSAYVPGLGAIGYEPEGNKRFYTIGFDGTSGAWANSISGFIGVILPSNYARVNIPSGGGWATNCSNLGLAGLLQDVNSAPFNTDNPQQFNVMAVGNLRAGLTCDVWKINELKFLSNTTSAL